MRSRCQKFVSLVLNFAQVNPEAAHEWLFSALTDSDPRSDEWRRIRRAMRLVDRQLARAV